MAQIYTNPKIPIIGDWMGTFGQVQDIMATPCDVEPQVWVYAFFAGAPAALYSLYKPDPFDMVTQRFGSGHKKRRRRRFRWDDMILLDKPARRGLQWVVFNVGKWAERVGWYLLIADVAFEWAYTWSSMAYQWSGCPNPNASYGWLAVNTGAAFLHDGYYAAWGSLAEHGWITVDDYRVIALTPMVATPYLELQVGKATPPYPSSEEIRFQLVELTSGWRGEPMVARPNDHDEPQTFRNVYRNYLGISNQPQYALHVQSASGFWSMKAKMGLNGETSRGLASDP